MSDSSSDSDASDQSLLEAVRNRAWRTRREFSGGKDLEGSMLGASVTGAEPSPPRPMPSRAAREGGDRDADARTLLEDNARLRQQLHQQFLLHRDDGGVREELTSSREKESRLSQRLQHLQRELEHERNLRRKLESELHATRAEVSQHGGFVDREALAVRQSALHATRVADTLREEKRLAEEQVLTLQRHHRKLERRNERLQRKLKWSNRKRSAAEGGREDWQQRAIHAENRVHFLEEQAKSLENHATTEVERTSQAVAQIRAETQSFRQQLEAATSQREASVSRVLAQCEGRILHLQKRVQRAKSQRDKARHRLALEREARQEEAGAGGRELRAVKAEWAGLVRRQQADLEETRRAVRALEDKNKELRTELRRAADAWKDARWTWARGTPSDISLRGALQDGHW